MSSVSSLIYDVESTFMDYRVRILSTLILCAIFVLTSCAAVANSQTVPVLTATSTDPTAAGIRCHTTDIQQTDGSNRAHGIIGEILVEGVQEQDTQFDRASVTITDKTRLLEQQGQDRRPVTFESLKMSQRVQARFIGPVAETYPVRATASEILILE